MEARQVATPWTATVDWERGCFLAAPGDDGVLLGPDVERAAFEDSPIGQASEVAIRNEPWCSFNLPRLKIDHHTLAATAYYCDSALIYISTAMVDSRFGTSWDDWSDEKEAMRHAEHQAWLEEHRGDRDIEDGWLTFPWGKVLVCRDPKTSDARMMFRYRPNPT